MSTSMIPPVLKLTQENGGVKWSKRLHHVVKGVIAAESNPVSRKS